MAEPPKEAGRSGQLALVAIACALTAIGTALTGPAGIALLIVAILMFLVAIAMVFRRRESGPG